MTTTLIATEEDSREPITIKELVEKSDDFRQHIIDAMTESYRIAFLDLNKPDQCQAISDALSLVDINMQAIIKVFQVGVTINAHVILGDESIFHNIATLIETSPNHLSTK